MFTEFTSYATESLPASRHKIGVVCSHIGHIFYNDLSQSPYNQK